MNITEVEDRWRDTGAWLPGDDIKPPTDYNITPVQIRDSFSQHVAPEGAEVVSLGENSLSALIPPKEMPIGFMFVDVDDFLNDLSGELQAIQYSRPKQPWQRKDNHDYGEDMFFDDKDIDIKQAMIWLVKQTKAGMRPAQDIDKVREYFTDLQGKGVYICYLAVSTPSSELITIENFLGQFFQGVGDGIVVIKGDYREVDKGMAAADVMRFVEESMGQQIPAGTPVAALDDWPNHLRKIRNAITGLGREVALETVQLEFPSNQEPDEHSVKKNSVLACVQHAASFLVI